MTQEQFVNGLGATQERLKRIRQLPFEQASKELENLKVEARALYRKLAFQHHPDRNPGSTGEAFRLLGKALQKIESLQVQRERPGRTFQVHVQFVPVVEFINCWTGERAPAYFPGAASPSVKVPAYDARRVVNLKPV